MAKEEVKVAEKVTFTEEVKVAKPIVAKPKYVKVKSKIGGKKFIGGVWYSFEKDKEVEVTEDAKRVLTESGAIYL
jgi:hypothetical protein